MPHVAVPPWQTKPRVPQLPSMLGSLGLSHAANRRKQLALRRLSEIFACTKRASAIFDLLRQGDLISDRCPDLAGPHWHGWKEPHTAK